MGAGLVAVLVDMQAIRPERGRSAGERQWSRVRPIASYRGSIVDRNGYVLAASKPSHQVVADPKWVEDAEATAALLSPILGIPPGELAGLLEPASPGDRFSLLARHVGAREVDQIKELFDAFSGPSDPMAGISLKKEEDRVYPAGSLGLSIIGRVDPDEQGYSGLEEQYNEIMTGSPGRETYELGRFGRISVGGHQVDPATPGYDLTLTIDRRIQYMSEQILLSHCEATGAKGAVAAMSMPDSGEILAMASVIRDEDGGCRTTGFNAALINTFEPGSVMKPVVLAGAVDQLGLAADSMVEVPVSVKIGGKTFEDPHPKPAAPYPLSEIIADSMNVGTIVISQQMEPNVIYDYLVGFGFGEFTGLGFEGESRGRLRSADQWQGADHGSIPIGQGMTANAAQVLGAYNVIANDGVRTPLTLVSSLVAPDGTTRLPETTPPLLVVSPQAANEITKSLVEVVEAGTGRPAAVKNHTVAGKTGTAWKVFADPETGKTGYGSPGNRRYVVTFAGFLPAEKPEFSLVVVVDEPQTATTATEIAAPIFSEIASYTARILEIAPQTVIDGGERVRAEPARPQRAKVEQADDVGGPQENIPAGT